MPRTRRKLYFDFRVANASLFQDVLWLARARSVTGSKFSNVGFTLNSYAYDNSGAQDRRGRYRVLARLPEPSSIGLLAIAAMATGTVGTRRFKSVRAGSAAAGLGCACRSPPQSPAPRLCSLPALRTSIDPW